MQLFGRKNKKNEEKKKEAPQTASLQEKKNAPAIVSGAKDVLMRPRVTEKAAMLTSGNVYTFDVRKEATKKDVTTAVSALYKVTPVKVRIVNSPSKRVAMRKRRGFGIAPGVKKAYVFLKDGESITLA